MYAIYADQLGWFWGVNIGIYGSPMECLGTVYITCHSISDQTTLQPPPNLPGPMEVDEGDPEAAAGLDTVYTCGTRALKGTSTVTHR